jgi:hypothetical protein
MRDTGFSRFGVSLFASAGILLCARAGGQISHNPGLTKSCEPRKTCTANSECGTNECCSTLPGENVTECTLIVQNLDEFDDTWRIHEAFDVIHAAAGDVRIPASGNLPIVAVSGTTTCSVGGTLPCDLGPLASATFRSAGYVVQPNDTNPLEDQGHWSLQDLCNAPDTQNCTTTIFPFSVTFLTNNSSGCQPEPCPPTPTPTATQTETPIPT